MEMSYASTEKCIKSHPNHDWKPMFGWWGELYIHISKLRKKYVFSRMLKQGEEEKVKKNTIMQTNFFLLENRGLAFMMLDEFD